jgi:hypothetical protein
MDENALKAAESMRQALLALNAYEPLATQYFDSPYDLTVKALRGVLSHQFGPTLGDAMYDEIWSSGEDVAYCAQYVLNRDVNTREQLDRLQVAAFAAAEGDSNDDEIGALSEALSAALAYIGGEWSDPDNTHYGEEV